MQRAWTLVAVLVLALAGCFDSDSASKSEPQRDEDPEEAPPGDESDTVSTPPAPDSAPPASPTVEEAPPTPKPSPGVVVADVSFGVNPYHSHFQRPGWTQHPSERVPSIPADLPAIDLTFTGNVEADLEADAESWANYETGQVYWVPETNLLLLTLEPYSSGDNGYNIGSNHGIATADAINQACSACYILVIQDWGNIDGGAMQYIADELPWVDFAVSTSYGFNNAEYVDAAVADGYAAGTRAIWDRGGIAFSPSGNGIITPSAQVGVTYSLHFVNMPPWVVLVGGDESICNAIASSASKPTEFTSDFTQPLATAEDANSTGLQSGTSFSTPKAAGLFAEALFQIRNATGGHANEGALWVGPPGPSPWLEDGRLTNAELREAMAQSARHFQTTDYIMPFDCPLNPPQRIPLGAGPVPASSTPWAEMGWGHLGYEEASQAASLILEGQTINRDEATVTWMNALEDARSRLYPW